MAVGREKIGVVSMFDSTYNEFDTYTEAEDYAKDLILEHIALREYPVDVKIVKVLHEEWIEDPNDGPEIAGWEERSGCKFTETQEKSLAAIDATIKAQHLLHLGE